VRASSTGISFPRVVVVEVRPVLFLRLDVRQPGERNDARLDGVEEVLEVVAGHPVVVVHDGHVGAASRPEADRAGVGDPGKGRSEDHDAQVRVALGDGLDDLGRPVGRAVDDHDHLEPAGCEGLLRQRCERVSDHVRAPIGGNDHGDLGWHTVAHA
jgi:hypothetical protein